MSRLNLNSIISWVDSHIIDYLMSLTRNKKILIFVCSVSVILLVFLSPLYIILWLPFPTVYFLYRKEYKSIFISWSFSFLIWYLIFTACMFGFDGPIVVKTDYLGCGEKSPETSRIFFYVQDKYFPVFSTPGFWDNSLGNVCLDTLFILGVLSSKLGFSIHIPSVFKALWALFKFFFSGKGSNGSGSDKGKGSNASGSYEGKGSNGSGFSREPFIMCHSPNEDSKPGGGFSWLFKTSKKPQEEVVYGSPRNPNRNNIFRSSKPEVNEKTYETCGQLHREMKKAQKQWGFVNESKTAIVDGNAITVSEYGNLMSDWFVSRRNICDIRRATSHEIQTATILREFKKQSKK